MHSTTQAHILNFDFFSAMFSSLLLSQGIDKRQQRGVR